MNKSRHPASAGSVPAWFPIAGFASLFLTLVFLMGLVVVGVYGKQVPDGTRPIVIFVLSIGVALATSFLGGSAVARGSIPLPGLEERPIEFSVGGGIAAFIICQIVGFSVYTTPSPAPTPVGAKTPVGLQFTERRDADTPSAALYLVFDDDTRTLLSNNADDAGREADFSGAQVSKDCRFVVYSSFVDSNGDDFIDFNDQAHVYLYDVAEEKPRRLTLATSGVPSWSPDSKQIAYRDERGGSGEVWVLNVVTGAAKQITHGANWAGHVKWSPNGQYISFYSSDAQGSYVSIVRPNGQGFRRLSPAVGNGWGTIWTTDNEISFAVFSSENNGAYLAQPHTGTLRPRDGQISIEDRGLCGWPTRTLPEPPADKLAGGQPSSGSCNASGNWRPQLIGPDQVRSRLPGTESTASENMSNDEERVG